MQIIEKNTVKNAILDCGAIAIIRGVKECDLANVIDALYQGGITVAEITFGVESNEQTASLIKSALAYSKDKIVMGAGTVCDLERAKIAKEAGAQFIVSPNFNEEVVRFCNQNNLTVICGALTPTEIYDAYAKGADIVKVFPANAFGSSYFKAVLAPFKNYSLFAFGGVTCDNIGEFIKAGALGAGIGSELINLKAISEGDFAYITNKAKSLIEAVNSAKQTLKK